MNERESWVQYLSIAGITAVLAASLVGALVYGDAHGGGMRTWMYGDTHTSDTSREYGGRTDARRLLQSDRMVVGGDVGNAPERLYLPTTLVAKAAIVVDTTNDHVLYGVRSSEPQPLASLTKVMTAFAALSILQESDVVVVPAALPDDGADGLAEGEKWTVKNLVDFMLVTSSNRAARALHAAGNASVERLHPRSTAVQDVRTQSDFFLDYMNATAQRIGMHGATFKNESGLDIADTYATNFGSAADVATLFTYVLHTFPTMLEATEDDSVKISSLSAVHTAVATNKALADIPGLVGGKTGFTDAAGGNLAIAFDVEPGHTIVAVVLGSGKDERFSDMRTLVEATRNAYGVATSKTVNLPM